MNGFTSIKTSDIIEIKIKIKGALFEQDESN
jgi:hypothetical protein